MWYSLGADAVAPQSPARRHRVERQIEGPGQRSHLAYDRPVVTSKEREGLRGPTKVADNLVRSRQRVADHGEVFTPAWLVENMLNLVAHEAERIDSRFLEPACGSGNFVVPVLRRKLASVHAKYSRSDFEKRHHALFALMCIYGIELLADNVAECRQNLLDCLFEYLGSGSGDEWFASARVVVDTNIVHGDALAMTTATGESITFPEWAYVGRGKFQRRDFRYDTLTQMSSFGDDTLFGDPGSREIFVPTKTYPPMTMKELGR